MIWGVSGDDIRFRDIYSNRGESNGKEHGTCNGGWDCIGGVVGHC